MFVAKRARPRANGDTTRSAPVDDSRITDEERTRGLETCSSNLPRTFEGKVASITTPQHSAPPDVCISKEGDTFCSFFSFSPPSPDRLRRQSHVSHHSDPPVDNLSDVLGAVLSPLKLYRVHVALLLEENTSDTARWGGSDVRSRESQWTRARGAARLGQPLPLVRTPQAMHSQISEIPRAVCIVEITTSVPTRHHRPKTDGPRYRNRSSRPGTLDKVET